MGRRFFRKTVFLKLLQCLVLGAGDETGLRPVDARVVVVRRPPVQAGEIEQPFAKRFLHGRFPQESFKVTVRLKTGAPGLESTESAQKYPVRSNWKRSPGLASASEGSP